MKSATNQNIRKRLRGILSGANRQDVLVAIWDTAPFLNSIFGVNAKEYYLDARTKLNTQVRFQEQFPGFLLFPGIWSDYGAICEPSAFGCEIEWKGGIPSVVSPALGSIGKVDRLKAIDPLKAGLLPAALEEYRFFWKHLDKKYIDEYGYLDGIAASFGPVELAAVLIGYEEFHVQLYREPKAMHALLRITADFVTAWLEAQQEVNGPLRRIAIADHIPGQINVQHFEEFFLPYTNSVLEAFPKAIRLYHNEFPVKYVSSLSKIKADIFHFGVDIFEAKRHLGNRMTLMGNVHPVNVLWQGTPKDVVEEGLSCLQNGMPGGRFLLSSGGGLAPDTPIENVRALEKAVRIFRTRKQDELREDPEV